MGTYRQLGVATTPSFTHNTLSSMALLLHVQPSQAMVMHTSNSKLGRWRKEDGDLEPEHLQLHSGCYLWLHEILPF